MKKRILAAFLAGVLAIGTLTACGSGNEDTTEAGAEKSEGGYKAAMFINSPISDGGWGTSCYQAFTDAAEECGWETAYTDNVQTADYVTVATDYADQGYNLIFAPGGEYQDAVEQVAAEYPDTYFCLLNGTLEADNITSVHPDANQIGYLAGALAGLTTKTNYIGFIGGVELDTTKAKLECYEAGAKAVNPDVQVASAYAGSFDDSAKGKEIATSMVTTYDIDVMFGDASAVDAGAREALAEFEGKYDIGQPGDLGSEDDKVIMCSVVTDNAALIKACMEDLENGTYGNKTIEGDISNGCLSVGTFSNIVPEDVKEKYLECVEQIKEGTFVK